MKRGSSVVSKAFSLILWIVLIVVCIKAFYMYKTLYFNGFTKGEYISDITEFTRDNQIKYGEERSFKMHSEDFNDAMFYKEIDVKPNTVYRVSCMVKTENVVPERENSDTGAMISIAEQREVSDSIVGTNDWQELTMTFNSKERNKVKLGFRLGGNDANAKGTAWFSELQLEEGITSNDTHWKMGCFIFKNIDVNIDGTQYKLSMSTSDINNVKENVERFTKSCQILSNNKMTAECDIIEVNQPITTISYSDEHGYYIDPQDVRKYIGETTLANEYDYIFVAVRMGNDEKAIPVKSWIGLGGMKLYDIGYSIIRMPNEQNSYTYTYDTRINLFPEEVYLHEFLHTLERIMNEYDYEIPELHAHEEYGYKEEALVSLKEWYRDYMQCKILDKTTGEYVGLDEAVYTMKPAQNSDFEYSLKIDFDVEPKNIIEEIREIFKVITNSIETITVYKDVDTIKSK